MKEIILIFSLFLSVKVKRQIYVLVFLGFFSALSYAQTDDTPKSGYWIGAGIGQCYFGPTFKFGTTIAYKENVFSVRYLKADEFRFNPGGADYAEPPLSFKEIGILYGRSGRKKYLLFSVSGGIGILNGTDRGVSINYVSKEYEKITISTICFPFEMSAGIEFTNNVGIDFLFFGNLNNKKIFYGGMIEIKIGKFN